MSKELNKPLAARMVCTLLVLLAAMLSVAMPAFAQQKAVVYDGTLKAWHGEGLEEQDVFMRFENVMPGDTLEHATSVRVDRPVSPVTVFVRLECAESDLEKLDGVACVLLADSLEVASGTLADIAADAVRIGEYSAPGAVELRLQVLVPTSLGNEHQFIEYPLNWRFIAQEDGGGDPGDGDKPTDPETPVDPEEPDGPDEPGGPTNPDEPGDGDKPGTDPEGPSAGGSDLLPQTGEGWLTVYGPLALGGLGILAAAIGITVLMRRGKKGE